MTGPLPLFPEAGAVVASPLCFYDGPCPYAGVAELGPEEPGEGFVNQTIRCLTCGRRGIYSRNTEPRPPGLFIKLDDVRTNYAHDEQLVRLQDNTAQDKTKQNRYHRGKSVEKSDIPS